MSLRISPPLRLLKDALLVLLRQQSDAGFHLLHPLPSVLINPKSYVIPTIRATDGLDSKQKAAAMNFY